MTYSCNDFSEDIVRCLVDANLVESCAVSDVDIGIQADLAIAAIVAAGQAAQAVRFVLAGYGKHGRALYAR